MGNPSSKPCQEHKTKIIEISNSITSVEAYEIASYYMFDDGIYNLGRVEVWYVMSCEVYNRLPLDQRISLNTYFMKWMSTLSQQLPEEKQRLKTIQSIWEDKYER